MKSQQNEMTPKARESLLPEGKNLVKTISIQSFTSADVTDCDCNEVSYGTGDAVFASFVVAPLVVAVWRSTWGIMELHSDLFPHAQTYLLGIIIHICFALIRSQLLARSAGAWSDAGGGAGRWLCERVLSRFYTYVFILSCIMHWRGGWGLLDATIAAILPHDDDPHRPVLMAAFTITFYLCIAALRSSRNILAPPYFLVTDGKEATYIFTTRFKKNSRQLPAPPLSADQYCSCTMRGSTAGLPDALAPGDRAHAILEFADPCFASLVLTPIVVTYWKSTWTLLDLYVFPDEPVIGAAVCAALGMCCDILLCLFQTQLSRSVSPEQGRLGYYVLSRGYTGVAGVACIAHFKGVWQLLNELSGYEWRTLVWWTGGSVVALVAMRAARNVCAVPFAVALDWPQGYFDMPTMFRTSSRETALYILDCVFSVGVVGSLVVFVWRGSWALLDLFLFPGEDTLTFWISLGIGYAIVVITFALQAPIRWAAARLHGAPRLLLADVYHLVSFLATVNVWRGVWGLLDKYFFPATPKFSNWSCHIISLALLILLNCSNSVIVRGVYIDAEEPAGECVVFPCHYLRLFFHKERTKRRHRRALAAAAAAATARKSEDASVPLQLPEEKV